MSDDLGGSLRTGVGILCGFGVSWGFSGFSCGDSGWLRRPRCHLWKHPAIDILSCTEAASEIEIHTWVAHTANIAGQCYDAPTLKGMPGMLHLHKEVWASQAKRQHWHTCKTVGETQ